MDQDRPTTVQEALALGLSRLSQGVSATPQLDVQLLLSHVLGRSWVSLWLDPARTLSAGEGERFEALLARRGQGEPVAYLTGEKEFWSLPLRVDRRGLIPRPDTETVVEEVAALFPDLAPRAFADVGTGSGCLAVALASLFPLGHGFAIDLDGEALALAGENIRALGFAERIRCLQGDLLGPLPEPVDLVVSNLPYIPTAEIPGLPRDVRCYEPLRALDGGADGLGLIRRLISTAGPKLRQEGWLVLEVGAGQAAAVERLFAQGGWQGIHTRKDLGQVERVVAARWDRVG